MKKPWKIILTVFLCLFSFSVMFSVPFICSAVIKSKAVPFAEEKDGYAWLTMETDCERRSLCFNTDLTQHIDSEVFESEDYDVLLCRYREDGEKNLINPYGKTVLPDKKTEEVLKALDTEYSQSKLADGFIIYQVGERYIVSVQAEASQHILYCYRNEKLERMTDRTFYFDRLIGFRFRK